jgi:peptide/nickel transport system permease protein
MGHFIVSRLLQAIPVLLMASVLVFLLIHFIPGDPAYAILGDNATPKEIEAVRAKLGLDRPLYVQYGVWIGNVLQGDLGASQINKFPVGRLIWIKARATVELTLGAMFVATVIAFPVGIISAIRRGSLLDRITTVMVSFFYAVPTFWLGILLVTFIALRLGWLPPSGRIDPSVDFVRFLKALVLPAITLGVPTSAVLARFVKMSMLEVLTQDYIRTARSKGLAERAVVLQHALRNALIPVVTVFGLQFGAFLGGAVVTESIFDWPGLGSTALHAIQSRDYPIVQGVVLFVVVVFILVNLLVDISYGFLDPRIRYD